VRVRFRRTRYGSGGNPARLVAEGGELVEVVHSADRLTVCALWRRRSGRLECRFAYGGYGVFAADGTLDPEMIEYVFLRAEGCSITSLLPRANPMRPAISLLVRVDPARLPATIRLPGQAPVDLVEEQTRVFYAFPEDSPGTLREGDAEVEILTSDGVRHPCLIGVDGDGTPVAASGFVRAAGS